MKVLFDQLTDRHRPLGAQQAIERNRTLQLQVGIDDIELPETIRQIRRLAQVIDGLSDRPGGRHRDELGLHAPTGGIFRIQQAARQRDAFTQRKLLQDFCLLVLRQVLQNGHRVIGVESAHAFGNRFGRQLLEDFVADGVVDFGQSREIEGVSHQLDQSRTKLRIECLDHIADVRLVQVGDQFTQHP